MVSYRVMPDVARELIWFVSGLLAVRRRQIGTRRGTRRLGCYRQALFALAWFRDKGDIPRPGRGFGLPQSTAYRYLDEVLEVLAARAPGLQEQLERALAEGVPYLILDGKAADTDRCREKTLSRRGEVIGLWYAGKTHDFGGNIQALFYPCETATQARGKKKARAGWERVTAQYPGCSPTGPGCRIPGGQDDRSRVTGDCYARICGSPGLRCPGPPRP